LLAAVVELSLQQPPQPGSASVPRQKNASRRNESEIRKTGASGRVPVAGWRRELSLERKGIAEILRFAGRARGANCPGGRSHPIRQV
jgi:hypothetical protein